jgi:hypothetical protein
MVIIDKSLSILVKGITSSGGRQDHLDIRLKNLRWRPGPVAALETLLPSNEGVNRRARFFIIVLYN